MSGVILGLIGAQLPLAWLADRIGRTTVLLGCYTTAVLGLACLPFCSGTVSLALGMWLVGSCAGAFYPLGLALLSENVPASGLARANAGFLAINCLGSVIGPIVTGAAMEEWGGRALFLAGAATVLGTLAIWALGRRFAASEERVQVTHFNQRTPRASVTGTPTRA
jgi:MFS family permease